MAAVKAKIALVMMALALAALACSLAGSDEPTPGPAAAITQIVITQVNGSPVKVTPYPTYTFYPTYTPYPTYTQPAMPEPVIIVVTETPTSTPEFSPTPPGPTVDVLFADKAPGFYLVGVDIGPGSWRSNGSGDNCYWNITTKTGETIKNHFGMAGGTMYIAAEAYQVQMDSECGTWTYLGP